MSTLETMKNNKEDGIMENIKTVEINGEQYVRMVDANIANTTHIIVIAQRGWIFEGHKDTEITDKIRLYNANVVRSWHNGRGIGGFTKQEYKDEYTLDYAGTVDFAPEGVICVIYCEW